MADKQSREVVVVEQGHFEDWGVFVTTADERRFAVTVDEYERLKGELYAKIADESKPTPVLNESQVLFETTHDVKFGHTGGDNTIRIADKPSGTGSLTVKIDVDVSEALTGLKAIQREAREAAKALRELEEVAKSYGEVTEESSMHIADTLARIAKASDKSITDDIRRSYE